MYSSLEGIHLKDAESEGVNLSMNCLKLGKEGVVLAVKITPKSSKSEIVGVEGEELKLRIAAVPEKGAANAEIIRFLAKRLKIGKSQVSIQSGETSRHKKVLIRGVPLEELPSLLGL